MLGIGYGALRKTRTGQLCERNAMTGERCAWVRSCDGPSGPASHRFLSVIGGPKARLG